MTLNILASILVVGSIELNRLTFDARQATQIVKKLFFCTLIILIAASYSSARIIDPKTGAEFRYKARLVEVAPVVDGFLDDPAWDDATSAALDHDVKEDRRWDEFSDFQGTFAAVWRNASLYIAIELTDDQIETAHEKVAMQDRLEVYIDTGHSGQQSDLYRYTLPVGQDIVLADSQQMLANWGNGGQSVELRFDLGRMPKKEDTISFGIYYYDVDGDRLNHQLRWGPAGQTEPKDALADLVFTANIKLNEHQKAIQWGRIKQLY